MSKEFITTIKNRRSIYVIGKDIGVSDKKLQSLVSNAVKYTPSAFNIQSSCVVLLLGKEHDKLWDIVKETLKKIVPATAFVNTETKVNSFKAGYGTVLFFDDTQLTAKLQKDYPLYKDSFPIWAEQASGMLQFAVWNILDAEGLGATLQHYNPLIDDEVKKTWKVPAHYKLIAQMPFGSVLKKAGKKEFRDISERLKVFK